LFLPGVFRQARQTRYEAILGAEPVLDFWDSRRPPGPIAEATTQECSMTKENDAFLAMFCTALEMKERKKALYEDALNACPDQVGQETFRILRDAELDHVRQIQEVYEELKQGKAWADACKFHPEQENLKKTFHRIAQEQPESGAVCADDVYALDTGMKLEEASIEFFANQLKQAGEPLARQFLERLVHDEREHFMLLADLKFYYTDPQGWFMEKSKARLDGGGGMA
jgi:rubrerythrin